MTRKEKLLERLKELNTDYYVFSPLSGGNVCLDGDYTIEEIEIILEIMKES